MRKGEWERAKKDLEDLYDMYEGLPLQPSTLRVHWIRYLIVRTSGFIETSISDFYTQYAEDKASPRIQRFIEKRMDRPGNMKMD